LVAEATRFKAKPLAKGDCYRMATLVKWRDGEKGIQDAHNLARIDALSEISRVGEAYTSAVPLHGFR
jgi:hypothetical protein